ncbi:MAG TPA: hypothetical protein VIX89_12525, partial [Bryobacteraceae bacterium]
MRHGTLDCKQKPGEASSGKTASVGKTRQPNPVAAVRHSIPWSAAGLAKLHTAFGNRAVMGLMRRAAAEPDAVLPESPVQVQRKCACDQDDE